MRPARLVARLTRFVVAARAVPLDMAPTTSTYGLTLTRGQADYLLRLVTIAELALTEHQRTGWVPSGQGDATLWRTQVEAIRTAASLEQPLRELAAWVRKD